MDNDSIVEQIVRSLSFEVEAVPQDNIIQVSTISKSAPLNVKIRVRKKEEAGFQHGVLSLPKPDRPDGVPERIRLVSSDQTIMSFNVVMEADFEKPVRKPRKNVFGVFKPTICLGAQPDEDKYAYLPSTTYKAEMNEESSSKSEGALKKFTLQKNEDSNETSATGPKRNKNIFGKCKPGGCLDPPFSDDRQPYLPGILNEQITTPVLVPEVTEQTVGQTAKNKTRTSSIFSYKLLNWKKKNDTHDALENNVIKNETKAESVLDLYQAGSLQTSTTYSNSIMTYPPTLNSSEHRIQEQKQSASDTYNDSPKNAYNVPSGNYFTVPKIKKNVIGKNSIENTIDIEDKDDIGDAKSDTINTKFEFKEIHDIAHSQDLVDDHNKHVLRTKDSVTDVRGAEIYFLESIHSKESSIFENDFESNSTANLASPKLHIPALTKTERIELDNIPFEEDQAQNIKVLTTPSSLTKISITDIPAVIERTPMRATQKIDNVTKTDRNEIIISTSIDKVPPGEITDKQELIHELNLFNEEQLPERIENYGKNITVPSKLNDEIKNIWTPLKIDTSNIFGSQESTQTEDFDDDPDLNTDASLRNRVKKSEKLSTHSLIEEICDANPATEFQTDNRWSEEQNILKSVNKPVPQTGSTSNTSVRKSKPVNNSGSDAVLKLKYENMPQNDENKYDSKSIVTLEIKQDSKDENKSAIKDLADNVSSDILVKKDALLETIYTEKDTFIENKLNRKLNDYKYNETLDEVIGQEISSETLNKKGENNLQKSENLNGLIVNTEFENDQRVKTVLKNSQIIDSLPQSGNKEQSVLLEDNALKMITQMNEIDSAASSLQESLFVRKITSTLVMTESNKATGTLDVTQPVSPLKETTRLSQTKAFSGNTIKEDVNVVSEVPLYNEYNDFLNKEITLPADDSLNKLNTYHIDDININELDTNKFNAESKKSSMKNYEDKIENDLINYNMETFTLQEPQPYQNKDEQHSQNEMHSKKRTDKIKANNKADAKHMTVYDEAKADNDDLDSAIQRKNSYLESDFNMYSKADSNIYFDLETYDTKSLEMHGFDNRFPVKHSHQAQVILDRKAQFKINLAIQSYLDDNNEVIVKSFDADNIPKRYLNDTVRVTKRSLEINDQINIPINSENDLSILIKCNKQKDISEDVGHSLGTGITRENKMGIACKNDVIPVKRKMIIADDIQRTLLAIYEEELVPLRNTISELKDHMKMLTAQHLLLKGHALVKKSRSRRIVPLYGKCGCIRR